MMKLKPVDYSGFSLRRLNEPRFAHIKLLGGWLVYFAMYFITENLIPVERCRPVHCALDDIIPFCEYFVIFYVGWYLLVAGSLARTLFFEPKSFVKLQKFIMITQAVAMLCYIFWPSRQDLRPEVFPRDNIFSRTVGFIYSFDTNTGVCPSLHVAYSLGILSVTLKDRTVSGPGKALVALFVLMVCLAVCFVKQHSAVDVFAAVPVCVLAELVLYWKDWYMPRLRGKTPAEK